MNEILVILNNTEWHHLMFVFALLFILLFRKQIAAFIQQISSISMPWVKATTNPESQSTADTKESAQNAAEKLIKRNEYSNVLHNVEESIKKDLEKEGLETEGGTIEFLVKNLAATNIILEFERIYWEIFGSQIALLKRMNEAKGVGLTKQDIRPYFEKARAAYLGLVTDADLDRYIGYLLIRNLISCAEEKYYLEEFGIEYLLWMVRNGKSENKAF